MTMPPSLEKLAKEMFPEAYDALAAEMPQELIAAVKAEMIRRTEPITEVVDHSVITYPINEQLRQLWALLGGSEQDIADSVFAVASELAEVHGFDVLVDPKMDRGDLYYQEWNAPMLAVITVLNDISKRRLKSPTEIVG